jgi:hypothetical protein
LRNFPQPEYPFLLTGILAPALLLIGRSSVHRVRPMQQRTGHPGISLVPVTHRVCGLVRVLLLLMMGMMFVSCGEALSLLLLEEGHHLALGEGRRRPLDLGVDVFHLGHATLAEG